MTNYDTTSLENAVIAALKTAQVSANIYSDRPKSKPAAEDFVVVKVMGNFEDMATYATGRLMVTMFARDIENRKNGTKLGIMYGKLVSGMPAQSGRYMFGLHPTTVGDRADDYGFHARQVIFSVTIKIQ